MLRIDRRTYARSLTTAAALLFIAGQRVAAQQAQPGSISVKVSASDSLPKDTRLRLIEIAVSDGSTMNVIFNELPMTSRVVTRAKLPAGRYRIEIKAVGFAPDTTDITLSAGASDTVIARFSPVSLAPIQTQATHTGRLVDFERRKAAGKGTFITREDIKKSGKLRVADLLRTVSGMRVECTSTCYVRMLRSPTCPPRFYLDGFPVDDQVLFTPILDVGGIEVYKGPSEIPPEFQGSQSLCGVVVIWTAPPPL